MSADFVTDKVCEIVAEQLGLPADDVSTDAAFSADLGADALDFMEIIMAFEEEFEIEIDEEDAETIRTVQDAIDHISHRMQ